MLTLLEQFGKTPVSLLPIAGLRGAALLELGLELLVLQEALAG